MTYLTQRNAPAQKQEPIRFNKTATPDDINYINMLIDVFHVSPEEIRRKFAHLLRQQP